jgi:hypothetical protein
VFQKNIGDFMRALLLASLLVFISCGKNNELQGSKATATLSAVELNRPYFTFNHDEGKSKFRSNLLNSIVAETFPSEQISIEFKYHDELDSNPVNTRELEVYKSKEQVMAKVVVSFTNRIEIFFMPEGVLVTSIAEKLLLQPDTDHSFKLLPTDYIKTTKGKTFYLVSVNHEDLMTNDQKFFQHPRVLAENFTAENIKLDGSKRFEFTVKYSFYTQQLTLQDFTKKIGSRMVKGCNEDGSCITYCTYKLPVPSSEFAKVSNATLSELGFGMKINGKVFPLESLNVQQTSDNSFKFSIVENEATIGESGLQIINSPLPSSKVATSGQQYGGNTSCSINETANVGHRAEFNVALTEWGRGEELRKIKL